MHILSTQEPRYILGTGTESTIHTSPAFTVTIKSEDGATYLCSPFQCIYTISFYTNYHQKPGLLVIPHLKTLIPITVCTWPILFPYSNLTQAQTPPTEPSGVHHPGLTKIFCLSPQPFHLVFLMKGFLTSTLTDMLDHLILCCRRLSCASWGISQCFWPLPTRCR